MQDTLNTAEKIRETGNCSGCGRHFKDGESIYFVPGKGFLCKQCKYKKKEEKQ